MVTSHRRVLCIDDEHMITDTMVLILARNGSEARSAYTAEQAIEIISEWSPDLAIIDVLLPVMNGIDLAVLLSARFPLCRILLVSGENVTSYLLAAIFWLKPKPAVTSSTFLAKPVLLEAAEP